MQEKHHQDAGDLPLSDVRVVDLSRLVSGNMMTHVLADLGATVIEVESPKKGDELRSWQRAGMSTYWLAYCRNRTASNSTCGRLKAWLPCASCCRMRTSWWRIFGRAR